MPVGIGDPIPQPGTPPTAPPAYRGSPTPYWQAAATPGVRQRGMFSQMGAGIPTAPSSWSQPGGFVNASVSDTGNNMAVYLYNQMLRYMDPNTKADSMEWLAQQNPGKFAAYANTQVPHAPQTRSYSGSNISYIDPSRLAAISNALQGMTLDTQYKPARDYLKQYIDTALEGYGGELGIGGVKGQGRTSRAAQEYAMRRLGTLTEQANSNPALATIATLGRNLVEPVIGVQSPAGGLGQRRAVSGPSGETYRRAGVSARNPWAT